VILVLMLAELFIPLTTFELTLAALEAAAELSEGMLPAITLLAVNVVPRPLPLHLPDVPPQHLGGQLLRLVARSGVSANVAVILARDRNLALARAIPLGSLVFVATRYRWWTTAEESLAQTLRRHGHKVTLLDYPRPLSDSRVARSELCRIS